MPPKKKTVRGSRSAAVHGNSTVAPTAGPGSGDGSLPLLPSTFHEAVEQLVELVRGVVDDTVTMFKLEMANVPVTQGVTDVVAGLSAKTQQELCGVVPLCEVRPTDLPANGCSSLFDQRQYAEALLHAVRAHFAFVKFDSRLIYTSTAGVRDPTAVSQLLYVFSYVKSAPARAEAPAAVSAAAGLPEGRGAANRRRTVAVLPRAAENDEPPAGSIGDELERFRDKLDRVERSLLEASQSLADEDMRLPETALDSSLEDVPTPALGTALHTVLPRVQAAAAAKRTAAAAKRTTAAKQKPPRGAVTHEEAVAASAARAVAAAAPPARASRTAPTRAPRAAPATARRGKRNRSLTPTPMEVETTDNGAAPTVPEPEPAAGPPSPSRQTAGHLPQPESDQLVAFFQKLNGSQTEQSRVSLTCRYAKMRYGHDVSSGVVYRLVEAARRRGAGPAAAAAEPAPLSEEGRRQAALAVYAELDPGHSEQSRVAYTLQYMRVQHAVRLEANTLFGWLGQGAKKPTAKRARVR
ncbi:uncharacterized protein LOC122390855 isoform X2 [Amphibalanus amphitrite]|nr:uncharacterized protein LOC122390855 isoform X2 [Amphibalanus amphitrite]